MVTLLIGGLAVVLARMTATQAVSFALDERGTRAYWAARAGLEWGSYQRAINSSCAPSTVVAMPVTATSLTEYQVTVTCTGSGPYLLTATACAPAAECGAPTSSTYVERVLTRTMP
jgi:MSHA biogenesis protein MshP